MKNRVLQLQELLNDHSAFYIQNPVNRRYITGFSSSAGVIVITKRDCFFFVDFRYFEKAQKIVTSSQVVEFQGISKTIVPVLKELKVNTVYLETEYVSFNEFQRLQDVLSEFSLSRESELDEAITQMRMVKTPNEIACIQQAQRLTDETFSYILNRIEIGKSELDIMLDMEFFVRKLGSEGVSFDFIVVSGKNSSLPHGVPTSNTIQSGDFITMDFGAVVNGYHSDMTRTVGVGSISGQQKEVYQTVWEAKNKALAHIAPGVVCKEVDKIARDHIDRAGFGEYFGHGLGHGVGLEIHENPNFNTRCETVLQPGMILTVEPGIYLPGQFGVRIEDMVEITLNGYNTITQSTDELILL